MKHQNQNAKTVRSFVSVSFQRADTIITCDDHCRTQATSSTYPVGTYDATTYADAAETAATATAYIAAQFISVMRRRERERDVSRHITG